MRVVSSSVEIAASPMQVWQVLANLESYREWNPFIQSATGELRVGATLTLRMVPSVGRAMTFRPRVLEVTPSVRLRWIGRLIVRGIFDGAHEFALEAGPGGTKVTQSEKFTGILVPLARKTLDSAANSDFGRLNQALKDRVERSAVRLRFESPRGDVVAMPPYDVLGGRAVLQEASPVTATRTKSVALPHPERHVFQPPNVSTCTDTTHAE